MLRVSSWCPPKQTKSHPTPSLLLLVCLLPHRLEYIALTITLKDTHPPLHHSPDQTKSSKLFEYIHQPCKQEISESDFLLSTFARYRLSVMTLLKIKIENPQFCFSIAMNSCSMGGMGSFQCGILPVSRMRRFAIQ